MANRSWKWARLVDDGLDAVAAALHPAIRHLFHGHRHAPAAGAHRHEARVKEHLRAWRREHTALPDTGKRF